MPPPNVGTRSWRGTLWRVLLSIGIGSWAAHPCAGETQGARAYGPPQLLGMVAAPQLTESSGLAVSRVHQNCWWTHNDSGGAPQLFAVNRTGGLLGIAKIRGARAVDWEDMASFTRDGEAFLVVADVGDNLGKRDTCQLYVLREPVRISDDMIVDLDRCIRFRFEGGPTDCESVAYDQEQDQFVLVSKTWTPHCTVYVLPWPHDAQQDAVARKVAQLPLAGITGMDISPDGRRAVLVTYTVAYEYARDSADGWGPAFRKVPVTRPMPRRKQGESICYGTDGATLYLTSEKIPCPLFEVGLRP